MKIIDFIRGNRTPIKEDLWDGLLADNKHLGKEELAYARYIVLNDIKPFDGDGIGYTSSKHVHVVIVGSDKLSLHIARQVALICHYPNFKDNDGTNKTIVTIINSQNNESADVFNVKKEFECITGNLLSECTWKCICGGNELKCEEQPKKESFIDLEFHFVGMSTNDNINTLLEDDDSIITIIDVDGAISEDSLPSIVYQYYNVNREKIAQSVKEDYSIDVRNAQKVNMIYQSGQELKSIEDLYKIDAYNDALKYYCSILSKDDCKTEWDKIKDPTIKLSNVFCADCLSLKKRCIEHPGLRKHKPIVVAKDLENLAKSEHARWNVEKLILGYRPLNDQEREKDKQLILYDKDKVKDERRRLKNELHAHIDICSCEELMRVDFDNFKFDCLLTLALREII